MKKLVIASVLAGLTASAATSETWWDTLTDDPIAESMHHYCGLLYQQGWASMSTDARVYYVIMCKPQGYA